MKKFQVLGLFLLLYVFFANTESLNVPIDVRELKPSDLHELDSGVWLVEIYAPWCGFCQRLEETYEKVAKNFKGSVNVARLDGDDFIEAQIQFMVNRFPTIFFIKNGEVRNYEEGYKYEDFENYLTVGWKKVEPLPFYRSPISLVGKFLAKVGILVKYIWKEIMYLKNNYGIDPNTTMLIGGFATIIFGIVAFLLSNSAFQKLFSLGSFQANSSSSSSSPSTNKSSKKQKEKNPKKPKKE